MPWDPVNYEGQDRLGHIEKYVGTMWNTSIPSATAIATIPRSNSMWGLGDSIIGNGTGLAGTVGPMLPFGYFNTCDDRCGLMWGSLLSRGKLRVVAHASHAGWTVVNATTTLDTNSKTLLQTVVDAAPGMCLVLLGTNDIGNSTQTWDKNSTEFVATISAFRTVFSTLWISGILPVVCSIPPRSSDSATKKANLLKLNAWLAKYAEENSLPFIDFYRVLVDQATGDYLAGYASDGIHPTNVGAKVMGQLISDTLTGTNLLNLGDQSQVWIPGPQPMVQTSNVDTGNAVLSGNTLSLTDTNADGAADGWTTVNAVTPSLAAIPATAGKGNYQVVTRVAADGRMKTATFTFAPGDVIYVAAKIASTVEASSGRADWTLSSVVGQDFFSLKDWKKDIPDGSVFINYFTVPTAFTAETTAQFQEWVYTSNGAVAKTAQLTILNLTALGMV